MKRILTVADLMTILCDCVDSGTLDINSEVTIDDNILGVKQRHKITGHKVIYKKDPCEKYLVLIPEKIF